MTDRDRIIADLERRRLEGLERNAADQRRADAEREARDAAYLAEQRAAAEAAADRRGRIITALINLGTRALELVAGGRRGR